MSGVLIYTLEVVGGPYDGVSALRWGDPGGYEPPERIYLGTCPGDALCKMACPMRTHVAYWVEQEDLPVDTVEYERRSFDICEPGRGVAIYALGGMAPLCELYVEEAVPAGAFALAPWEAIVLEFYDAEWAALMRSYADSERDEP